MRLLTISISHYCERARWALEHVGLEFEEEPHLQMFLYRPVRPSGGGESVPVLVTDEGQVLDDSLHLRATEPRCRQRPRYPKPRGGSLRSFGSVRRECSPCGCSRSIDRRRAS